MDKNYGWTLKERIVEELLKRTAHAAIGAAIFFGIMIVIMMILMWNSWESGGSGGWSWKWIWIGTAIGAGAGFIFCAKVQRVQEVLMDDDEFNDDRPWRY